MNGPSIGDKILVSSRGYDPCSLRRIRIDGIGHHLEQFRKQEANDGVIVLGDLDLTFSCNSLEVKTKSRILLLRTEVMDNGFRVNAYTRENLEEDMRAFARLQGSHQHKIVADQGYTDVNDRCPDVSICVLQQDHITSSAYILIQSLARRLSAYTAKHGDYPHSRTFWRTVDKGLRLGLAEVGPAADATYRSERAAAKGIELIVGGWSEQRVSATFPSAIEARNAERTLLGLQANPRRQGNTVTGTFHLYDAERIISYVKSVVS